MPPANHPSPSDARYALIVLTVLNALNYIDRYVPSSLKDLLRADLHLNDIQTSIPLTAFLVVYLLTSPIFSTLADKQVFKRKHLICFGVVLWSIATTCTALCQDFVSLLLTRSIVGIGEASFSTIAAPLIADYYPSEERNQHIAVLNVALPIGAALGFVLGGVIADAAGWRVAFLVVGLPGLLAALAVLRINEPALGAYDDYDGSAVQSAPVTQPIDAGDHIHPELADSQAQAAEDATSPTPTIRLVRVQSNESPESDVTTLSHFKRTPTWIETFKELAHNYTYIYAVIGVVLTNFGVGGIADWISTFYQRVHGIEMGTADLYVGGITVIGGIGGTIIGSKLADYAAKPEFCISQPYLLVSSVTVFVASLLGFAMLIVPSATWSLILLTLCQIALWCYNAPIQTLVLNSTHPHIRNRAAAIQIFASHALGDAISPSIIGAISDGTGGNLTAALFIVPASVMAAGLVWLIGSQHATPPHGSNAALLHEQMGFQSPTTQKLNAAKEALLSSDESSAAQEISDNEASPN